MSPIEHEDYAAWLGMATSAMSPYVRQRIEGMIADIQTSVGVDVPFTITQVAELAQRGELAPEQLAEIEKRLAALHRLCEAAVFQSDWENLQARETHELESSVMGVLPLVDGRVVYSVKSPLGGHSHIMDPLTGERTDHLNRNMVPLGTTPDNRVLLQDMSAQNYNLHIWDPVNGNATKVPTEWGGDAKYLAGVNMILVAEDTELLLYDVASGGWIHRPFTPESGSVVGFVAKNHRAICVSDRIGIIFAVDQANRKKHIHTYRNVATGADFLEVVAGGAVWLTDGTVWYWNAETGKKRALLHTDDKGTRDFRAVTHPANPHLLAVAEDWHGVEGKLRIFDTKSGSLIGSYPYPQEDACYGMCVLPNGRIVMAIGTKIHLIG